MKSNDQSRSLTAHVHADAGASAVEYALLITGIALVIVAAVFALGGPLAGIFTSTTTELCLADPTLCT